MLSVVAAIIVAAAATASPSPLPQTPGSNITVSICRAQLDKPPLKIGYTNVASRTATEVDFTVVGSAGVIQTVKDIGSFETGKQIVKVFDLPPDISPLGLGSARCTVTRVIYADGTVWNAPT